MNVETSWRPQTFLFRRLGGAEGALGRRDEQVGYRPGGEALASEEEVEGLEARQYPECAFGVGDGDLGSQVALRTELLRDAGHRGAARGLPPFDGASDGPFVQLRHGVEGADDVALAGEHLGGGAQPAAQLLTGVRVSGGLDETLAAREIQQLGAACVDDAAAGW